MYFTDFVDRSFDFMCYIDVYNIHILQNATYIILFIVSIN